ncbi:MAG: nitroreductase family deazaflavin-dependent oxidoreductase [Anaerolineales bacterium]|nr:MAG: nitroreductase family deazaflavin-dependent oxidoreductase [Anaerolineales bacterium]
MSFVERVPRWIWRLIRIPPQLLYALGLGPLIGPLVLLLTTKGRRTGKWRVTPLQYERVGDLFYVAAARGMKTDWLRNILADPQVEIRVNAQRFKAIAEVVRDPGLIADFLTLRLRNRPRFVGRILRMEGFPDPPTRQDLETYAAKRVMVVLYPT